MAGSALETVLSDRAWLELAIPLSVVTALTLLRRRTHSLPAVAVAFGTLIGQPHAGIEVTSEVTVTGCPGDRGRGGRRRHRK